MGNVISLYNDPSFI